MRLLMVAPPGAGKGTQAKRLAEHYRITHLSSGDLFRRQIEQGTSLGRTAKGYLDRGDLVPDELVLGMLQAPILEAAAAGGYVLDGFPRTLPQAEEAYQMARQLVGVELQAVVHLKVGHDELRRRLLARAEAEGRTDDQEATVNHRIEVYDRQTEPLLGFYAERGLVVDIDGEAPIDSVFDSIVAAVDSQRTDLV